MATAIHSLLDVAADPEVCPCRGVVFYPDAAARDRALELYGRISERFEGLIDLDFRWWKFEFLKDSSLMGKAVLEAAPANILVLSYSTGTILPDETRAFFELWIDQRKKGPCAIVGLRDSSQASGKGDRLVTEYLQQIADRAQVDLITGARVEWQSEMAQISCRAHHVTPTLEAILHHGVDPVEPAQWNP